MAAKKYTTLAPKREYKVRLKNDNDEVVLIADNHEIKTFKDDLLSMEYPLFAMKAGDIKPKEYNIGSSKIKISCNENGIATILDKDIWIYAISKIQKAISSNEEVSRTVVFTAYDYLKSTNKSISKPNYDAVKTSLRRLKGTTVETNIITNDREVTTNFGLIETWKVQEGIKRESMDVELIEITLPLWLFEAIQKNEVLKINSDYFRIRKSIDRRIYEIARKHCGYSRSFSIGLEKLYEKSGSSSALKSFKHNMKVLAEQNDLPDYNVIFDHTRDIITFKPKDTLDKEIFSDSLKSKSYHKKTERNKDNESGGDESNNDGIPHGFRGS